MTGEVTEAVTVEAQKSLEGKLERKWSCKGPRMGVTCEGVTCEGVTGECAKSSGRNVTKVRKRKYRKKR